MLMKNYTMEIFRPECNPQFQSLHCFAHLDEDIREVFPYLNTVLGGSGYTQDPPSLMLQIHGRLIAFHPKKIAINALKNDKEAEKILEWLRREINQTWEKRNEITPSYEAAPRPMPFTILKFLPRTNCGRCGQATCLVFASLAVEGGKGADDCPELTPEQKKGLEEYLGKFRFNW
jgi:ArsR family metal-binding transcriptional regulator